MKITCIIPARLDSKRFPGKVLADIAGKPMLQHVYEQAGKSKLVDRVVVAAGESRIVDAVRKFGGESILTPECRSGTDRVAVAAEEMDADIIVNVQGDEPLITPEVIDSTVGMLVEDENIKMATAASPASDTGQFNDTNVVKVVVDRDSFALYFSRSPIPSPGRGNDKGGSRGDFLKHIGIYVYRKEFLKEFVNMKSCPLEEAEKLEQLRALENGCRIKIAVVEADLISVDTAEDISMVEREMEKRRKLEERG